MEANRVPNARVARTTRGCAHASVLLDLYFMAGERQQTGRTDVCRCFEDSGERGVSGLSLKEKTLQPEWPPPRDGTTSNAGPRAPPFQSFLSSFLLISSNFLLRPLHRQPSHILSENLAWQHRMLAAIFESLEDGTGLKA